MRTRHLLRAGVLALVLGALGCGGGGSPAPSCTRPGTFQAIAVAGDPAHGTLGDWAAFPTAVPMDVASGGWAAFIGATTDGTKTSVLEVREPGVGLVLVFAVGDLLPPFPMGVTPPALGAITGLDAVRVNTGGWVAALVTTASGDQVLLSARVDSGGVAEQRTVLWTRRDMASTGLAGLLSSMDTDALALADDGTVGVLGKTNMLLDGFWVVAPDGSGLDALVGTGDGLPGGDNVETISVALLHPNGTRFFFVCEDDAMEEGLYTGTTGSSTFDLLAEEGDALPGGAVVNDVREQEQPAIYASGSAVLVVEDDSGRELVVVAGIGLPLVLIARQGDAAPGTGRLYDGLGMLNNRPECAAPVYAANLGGTGTQPSFVLYGIVGLAPPTVALAMYDGRTLPGGTSGPTFPGLASPGRHDVSADGSIAFANVLASGSSGVWWLVPDCGLFALALGGQAAVGGGTFDGASQAWRQTAADGIVMLRAPLVGGGSGLYVQGP